MVFFYYLSLYLICYLEFNITLWRSTFSYQEAKTFYGERWMNIRSVWIEASKHLQMGELIRNQLEHLNLSLPFEIKEVYSELGIPESEQFEKNRLLPVLYGEINREWRRTQDERKIKKSNGKWIVQRAPPPYRLNKNAKVFVPLK